MRHYLNIIIINIKHLNFYLGSIQSKFNNSFDVLFQRSPGLCEDQGQDHFLCSLVIAFGV